MGLGFYTASQVNTNKRADACVNQMLLALKNAVEDLLKDADLDAFTFLEIEGDSLFVEVHPAAEPITFSLRNDRIICHCKTNSAGPGYHKFALELVESLEKLCGLSWQWNNEEEGYGDETGYVYDRDFDKLQHEMWLWLKGVICHILDRGISKVSLCLPEGFNLDGDYFAIHPMGFMDVSWAKRIAESKSLQEELANSYFPWWEEGFSASFWKNMGLTSMWTNVKWRNPANTEERETMVGVLRCFEKASKLCASLALPDWEIHEIKRILGVNPQSEEIIPNQHASLIGFFRWKMRRPLTGEWTISVPGFFYERIEANGETVVLWHDDITIKASSISYTCPEGYIEDQAQSYSKYPLFYKQGHLVGKASVSKSVENDEPMWTLSGVMTAHGSGCIITVSYRQKKHEQDVVRFWKSLYRPRQKNRY